VASKPKEWPGAKEPGAREMRKADHNLRSGKCVGKAGKGKPIGAKNGSSIGVC